MPRQTKFNRDKALDNALEVFWLKGFESTTVRDLGQHMELHPGSLYGTFGEKRDLFLEVLDRYETTFTPQLIRILAKPGMKIKAISELFNFVIDYLLKESGPTGCIMTNTAVEVGESDEVIKTKVLNHFCRLEDAIFRCLEIANSQGEFKINKTDEELLSLAKFLNTTLQGIRVIAKVNPNKNALVLIQQTALSLLA